MVLIIIEKGNVQYNGLKLYFYKIKCNGNFNGEDCLGYTEHRRKMLNQSFKL